jgi:hypothetical protein
MAGEDLGKFDMNLVHCYSPHAWLRSVTRLLNCQRGCNRIVQGQSVGEKELVLSTMGKRQRSIYTCSRYSSTAQPACRRRLFWAVL